MGSLRRPLLVAVLLGTAILVSAAIGLAGPLDPAPDEAEANTSVETGTPADGVAEDVGLENEHEIETSADEADSRTLESSADDPSADARASAEDVSTEPHESHAPAPASDAADAADEVSVTVTFSTEHATGTVVEVAPDTSAPRTETTRTPGAFTPDGRLSLGVSARNTDVAGGADYGTLGETGALGTYYGSSLPPASAEEPRPNQAVRAPSDQGPDDDRAEPNAGSGSASTQSTNAAAGLTDVVGLDDGTKAAAAAAFGALPILVWFLYHRIKGHDVLENETRKAIYDEVCREPGLGIKDLAEVADVSYSTASYHLDRLEDADMVVSSKRGKKLCYFQNGGTFSEGERELLKVLRNEEAMRVFLDIHQHPGTYRTRIAERLDVSTTTVNWHLDGLVEAGLVREDRDGRTAHLYVDQERLDDRVRPLLEKAADAEEVEAPATMSQLRSRLEAPAPA